MRVDARGVLARRGFRSIELTAVDVAGEVLDVELAPTPADPDAWAVAHAVVAGAIAGVAASSSWTASAHPAALVTGLLEAPVYQHLRSAG